MHPSFRPRPARLLVLASAASVVRWAALALVTAPVALVAIQILHAASFGAFYVGSVKLVDDECPPSLRVVSQGIYRAVAFGLAPAASLFLAGCIEGPYGLRGVFAVGAAAAAIATAVASRLALP
jgi:PPP family 3-phenylpropionic acid transporter